ncbi:MAG: diacylglycerol kinase family lipid kinase [Elusimicrobiota bacterium]|nr:diacylglycerol kinase family lipid kinase [Elusimicrobiota bacterium]
MPSTIFIINPAAGHGRAGRVWASFKEAALRLLPDSASAVTGQPGHASALALEAVLAGASRVIAVGGDGTFSEALEGVMAAPEHLRRNITLGAIPAGSGCDLARHLGYPGDRDGLLDLLARGTARPMDVGRINYSGLDGAPRQRHFMNIAAFGLAGDVAHQIKASGKPLGGTISYFVSSVLALLTAKAKTVRLKADGKDLSGRYHLGVLANTSSMGGGMMIAPGAKDDDGLMDLVLVSDMSRLSLMRNFPALYKGTHLASPGITMSGVRRLEAEADETVYLNIDGEADGKLPAVFETLPRAINVIAPRGLKP